MKQTAIDWLIEQLKINNYISDNAHWLIDDAIEMEKQQIIDAFVECWKANMPDGFECKLSAKQYYNETFKKK